MANQEHLDILRQGVEAWNRWRREHPDIRPNLRGVDLSKADLRSANLTDADFTEAILSEANLSESDLRRAILDAADLSSANLMAAALSQAILSSANLSGANLIGTILIGTILSNVDLSEADLSDSELAFTIFGDVDLSVVKGLDRVRHTGSSSIGIDTFYRSEGIIPEVFLRGAGVPDSFLTLIHSQASKPVDYYSCFISYSSQDQAFAEQLYTDLQAVGVRCWFAPADLKIGDNLTARIDEAIRIHDKLLLVLSKNSILSKWVATEVNVALSREVVQKRIILFPIRIDDSIMESRSEWAAQLRHTKNIGDFRQWWNSALYQRSLVRLIRDLTLSVTTESDERERTK